MKDFFEIIIQCFFLAYYLRTCYALFFTDLILS